MRCEYTVSWPLFRSWLFLAQRRWPWLFVNILWLVLGIGCAALAAGRDFSALYWFLAAFCLYRALFRWLLLGRRQYKRLAALCGGENWRRVIEFGPDRLTMQEGTVSVTYPYGELTDIQEKNGEAVLVFAGKGRIVLPAGAFTAGSWAACRAMLEAGRTGQ